METWKLICIGLGVAVGSGLIGAIVLGIASWWVARQMDNGEL